MRPKEIFDLKKLVRKLLYFLSPLLLVLLLLENYLPKVSNDYTVKKQYFENDISEYEILVLGSSHAATGIDPKYFDKKGFNLAQTSQSLYYDLNILKKYIDRMTKLKVVIIPISYFSLEYNLDNTPAESLQFYYKRFYDIPLRNRKNVLDLRNYSYVALYGGEESIKYALSRSKHDVLEKITETGWVETDEAAEIKSAEVINQEDGERRVEYHHSIMEPKSFPDNVNYLEEMIILLRARNIKPLIITTPVYSTYSDNIDKVRYQKTIDSVNLLENKYGIKYINYFKDQRFVKEEFRDNDHLNNSGAVKFSKILYEDILTNL